MWCVENWFDFRSPTVRAWTFRRSNADVAKRPSNSPEKFDRWIPKCMNEWMSVAPVLYSHLTRCNVMKEVCTILQESRFPCPVHLGLHSNDFNSPAIGSLTPYAQLISWGPDCEILPGWWLDAICCERVRVWLRWMNWMWLSYSRSSSSCRSDDGGARQNLRWAAPPPLTGWLAELLRSKGAFYWVLMCSEIRPGVKEDNAFHLQWKSVSLNSLPRYLIGGAGDAAVDALGQMWPGGGGCWLDERTHWERKGKQRRYKECCSFFFCFGS